MHLGCIGLLCKWFRVPKYTGLAACRPIAVILLQAKQIKRSVAVCSQQFLDKVLH